MKEFTISVGNERGQSLLELAITAPLLLLIAAGLINIVAILFAVEPVLDAIRTGGVYAYLSSGPLITCNQLTTDTKENVELSLQSALTDEQMKYWDSPQITINTIKWDGFDFPYANVKLQTKPSSNCLFCYANLLQHIGYTAVASFPLRNNCL